MAELTPIPSAQRPSEPAYQPVSGYAVAASLVAGFFLIILLVLIVASFNSRQPLLSYELLVLAATGVILAAIARSQIRNSEGTRIGIKLANAAWWVSVLGGAGFAAYLFANQMVLERESGKLADRVIAELQAGRTQNAFYEYMLPPEERRVEPEDPARSDPVARARFEEAYGPEGYAALRNHDVVRLIARNPNAVEFERVGLKEFGQEGAGFRAAHTYRMKCPEGIFEFQVGLVAAESRKGGTLRWRVQSRPAPSITSLSVVELSQYGRLLMELQQEGEATAQLWIQLVAEGRMALAQLMTTPREHRQPIEDSLRALGALVGGPSMPIPVGPAILPPDRGARLAAVKPADASFEDFRHIGFFRPLQGQSEFSDDKWSMLRDLWRAPRLSPTGRMQMPGMAPADATSTLIKPDSVTVVVSADLYLESRGMFIRCAVGAECTQPAVLAALNSAREQGYRAPNDGSVTLRTLPSCGWRIAWLRTDMEPRSPMPVEGPGGGPGS